MNAFFKSISIILLLSGSLIAREMATPLTVFSEKFAKVAENFERAKIETTSGGFYFRADSHSFFKANDLLPSSEGFWLGVRVLSIEDLTTATAPPKPEPSAAYIEKVVKLKVPKVDGGDSGLLITLRYGAKCDAKVISELLKGIDVLMHQGEESLKKDGYLYPRPWVDNLLEAVGKPSEQQNVFIKGEAAKLATSQVPTQNEAANLAIGSYMKSKGLDDRESWEVVGLYRNGRDVADFAKAGDLVWEVRVSRPPGVSGVSGVIWVSTTTKDVKVLFP